MNTFEASVLARLKTAGLLDAAERAAKRVELRLADCIAPGDVTGGHHVLWLALGKHRSPSQVAALVGFPEESVLPVFRDAVPEPRPTPAPKSGPRAKRPRVVESKRRGFWAPDTLPEIPDLDVPPTPPPSREVLAMCGSTVYDRLVSSGLMDDVRAACARHKVAILEALGRSREAAPTRARTEIAWRLFRLHGRNHSEIGRLIDRDPSSVRAALLAFRPDEELLALLPKEKAA